MKQDNLKQSVPPHLHQFALPDDKAERYYELVTNWTKLAKIMKEWDTQTVAEALVVELRTRKRLHIIHALQTRYKSLRAKDEDRAIVETLVNQQVIG